MDIFDETKIGLKKIWDDAVLRQHAKIIITTAIGNATELSVKQANDIMDELDLMLLETDEDTQKVKSRGL